MRAKKGMTGGFEHRPQRFDVIGSYDVVGRVRIDPMPLPDKTDGAADVRAACLASMRRTLARWNASRRATPARRNSNAIGAARKSKAEATPAPAEQIACRTPSCALAGMRPPRVVDRGQKETRRRRPFATALIAAARLIAWFRTDPLYQQRRSPTKEVSFARPDVTILLP